jgi:predicted ATPase
MLKLVAGFFGNNLQIFRQVEFNEVAFELSDGRRVLIRQTNNDQGRQTKYFYSYKDQDYEYDPSAPIQTGEADVRRAPVSTQTILRYIPFLRLVGVHNYLDTRTHQVHTYRSVLDTFGTMLPPHLRSRRAQPTWLQELRSAVHCRLIETQRLLKMRQPHDWGDDTPAFIPVVTTYAESLAGLISQKLAESATLSQTLDRTFPTRLIQKTSPAMNEPVLRDRLSSLERRRARLMETGLLEKSEDNAFIPADKFDKSTRQILSEYVGDAEQKLNIFNDLLSRLELLTQIINNRFQFKKLVIDRQKGFLFRDVSNREVSLDSLSSGEQHELVLVYDLLFSTKQNTLLLIDEPEISLHIAWQKQFIPDLERIINLAPMDVLISTHSPQLIGAYIALAVQLKGPGYASSISE